MKYKCLYCKKYIKPGTRVGFAPLHKWCAPKWDNLPPEKRKELIEDAKEG